MVTPKHSDRAFDPHLIDSGTFWLPRASLSACLRGTMTRSTKGHNLSDHSRVSYFPASPVCSLSWWFTGDCYALTGGAPGQMPGAGDTKVPVPGRWILGGPQTQPTGSWCPGAAHGMMVMFMPDALHALTGLEPAELTDRIVDATTMLPPDWLLMCQQVHEAPDDAQRMVLLEAFLEPRWLACRPDQPLMPQRYADWVTHLAMRAAMSGPGRSLRQLERRVKRWAGLPMRELRGLARSERAFFDAVDAHSLVGSVRWSDVANDNGYADQSHLCRDVRRITGFSPEELRKGIASEEPFWAYRIWM